VFSVEDRAEGLPGRQHAVTTITACDASAPPASADGNPAGWLDSDRLPAGWQWITEINGPVSRADVLRKTLSRSVGVSWCRRNGRYPTPPDDAALHRARQATASGNNVGKTMLPN